MSSTDLHVKIQTFLAGEFAHTEHEMCVRVDLAYAPPSGYRQDPLKAWTPQTHPDLFASHGHAFIDRLVSEVLELAENHADSYPAPMPGCAPPKHRFVLRTTQHLGGRATHSFSILPGYNGAMDGEQQALVSGGGGGGAGSTPPTPGLADRADNTGVIGQLMRHLENRDRIMLQKDMTYLTAIGHAGEQLREENNALRAQISSMAAERLQWLNTIEEARSLDHERQIQAQVVVAGEERKTYTMKKIVNLFPVIVSKMIRAQKKLDDGGLKKSGTTSPLAKLVGELLTSLDEKQRDFIGDLLSPEQQIAFTEVANVVEDGEDSVLLPQMLYDLATSMKDQMPKIAAILNDKQRVAFAQAIQLASPKPTGETDGKSITASETTS